MARAFSNVLKAGLAVVDKRRLSPEESSVGFIIGEVADRNILLVDDMITTGGSLSAAAVVLKEKGARQIFAAAAHPVFCGPAVERIAASPISKIVVTDSIPLNSKAQALGDRIQVLTVSKLLGEAVHRIHMNESVSSLFMKQ